MIASVESVPSGESVIQTRECCARAWFWSREN